MKLVWLGLVAFLSVCFDDMCVKSQETEEGDETRQSVLILYCREDFECTQVCESYVQASDKCSCHPACKLFKDCCYDTDNYVNACSHKSDYEALVSDILPKYDQYFQCTTDLISEEKYWMVSKCPDSWSEPNECDIINQTTPITVGRLEDGLYAIPVVSPDGVTFRNIYCATCHGENPENLTLWSFEAEECVDTDMFETRPDFSVKDKVRYLVDNCEKVSFLPPTKPPGHFSTLIPCRGVEQDVIDVCENPAETSTVAENCSLVAAPIEFNGNTFKNTFCLDCFSNYEVELLCYEVSFAEDDPPFVARPPLLCSIDVETGEVICPTPEPPLPPLVPISITFDFGGQTGGVSITKRGDEIERTSISCKVGQVFDPLESKCVHLACPDGYFLRGAVCVQRPNVNNNDTVSCPRFALDVTVGSLSNSANSCSSSLENILECLPEDLMFLFVENLKYNNVSCQTGNSSQLMFQTFTSSMDVVNGILSSHDDVDSFSSQISGFCSSVGFVEILVYCSPSQSKLSLECGSRWLNKTQWQVLENSTEEILIEDTLEVIPISKTKIQSYFKLSFRDNSSRTIEGVSIMRCNTNEGEKTTCPFLTLNSSLFEPENNGSKILIYTKNKTVRLKPDMYKLYPNGSIQVCNFLQSNGTVYFRFLPEYSHVEAILSTVGISLSIAALSFTLLTYCVFSEVRSRMANILIMILCSCLIPAQILLIIAGVATVSTKFCAVVSGLSHFLWLAAFTTTSVLGFALSQTFSLRNQVIRGREPSWKAVTVFSLICFCPPTLTSGTLLILYFMDADRFGITYGSSSGCWIGEQLINFFFFGIPVGVCLLLNFVFFLHVTLSLCIQMRSSERVRKSKEGFKLREALIYIKIFVVLGLTWIFGFLAAVSNIQFLWYVFTLFTSLQGVFIFLAFTVKSHIWRMWGKRFGLVSSDLSSRSTPSRSQRSYDKYSPKTSTAIYLPKTSTTSTTAL
ncbi:Adhesion G protein-coupled receptor L1 [Holothuria leucospilota]|uniref:Adhesion G protein-coupled receptor L1 n=1 Tax=Holothuria leucospilota TaxID=206669 RepID=A0A9Q1CKQ3_HOLLE|nr:Adhesion G protein-coupled receptor L1 [Holothuria leucospilota]